MSLDLKNIQFVRNLGNASNYVYNLLKDIEAVTSITFPPMLIEKTQRAHELLDSYQNKKCTQLQVQDAMASAGLAFYKWVLSTHNRVSIEGVAGAKTDPLGSLKEAVSDKNKETAMVAVIAGLQNEVQTNRTDDVYNCLLDAYNCLYAGYVEYNQNPNNIDHQAIRARCRAIVDKYYKGVESVVVPELSANTSKLMDMSTISATEKPTTWQERALILGAPNLLAAASKEKVETETKPLDPMDILAGGPALGPSSRVVDEIVNTSEPTKDVENPGIQVLGGRRKKK